MPDKPASDRPPARQTSPQVNRGTAAGHIRLPLIATVVVILIVVAGAYFFLGHNNSQPVPSRNSTTVSTTVIPFANVTSVYNTTASTTSVIAVSSLPTSTTSSSGGLGGYYMSQSEAVSLIGSGGSYIAKPLSQSELNSTPPSYDITGGYDMWYNITTGTPQGVINDVVFITGNSSSVYATILSGFSPFFNQTYLQSQGAYNVYTAYNSVLNGMTYSYTTYSFSNNGQVSTDMVIIANENDDVTVVKVGSLSSSVPSVSSVVSIVAGDLS